MQIVYLSGSVSTVIYTEIEVCEDGKVKYGLGSQGCENEILYQGYLRSPGGGHPYRRGRRELGESWFWY